ncbi:TIGR01906 family membrane protein [Lentilactobacillus sp. SPB1-3]|uniref:TIGR01906 family membrane protein n=1 Tax=Lentilactobacillus terminaliae TaxID=3003483 RepID=A0ACD5DCT3_9LACO|nr:TIGR01906 family membrane protein [Lentilactobacillus sp. SPB1-3]MCZ0977331.1 TIGR01906 family membrane protein [Lentilactobacillus sp. SPB1-3]
MMKSVSRKQWLSGLCVILFSMSLAIFLTVNSVWLFDINMHTENLKTLTGLSFSQMHQEYLRIIDYLQNPFISQLNFKCFRSSAAGLLHFRDVRHLIMLNNVVLLILIPVMIICWRNLWRSKLTWLIMSPIKIVVTVFIMVVAMMMVNFNQVFIWFHELLFRNEDWIFDPDKDPVINMLPESLFLQLFLLFFVLFFLLAFLWYFLAKWQLKNAQNNGR